MRGSIFSILPVVAILLTDSATDETQKIPVMATVIDTYNSSSSVLVTAETSTKRRKRSTEDIDRKIGKALPPGCKYGK